MSQSPNKYGAVAVITHLLVVNQGVAAGSSVGAVSVGAASGVFVGVASAGVAAGAGVVVVVAGGAVDDAVVGGGVGVEAVFQPPPRA